MILTPTMPLFRPPSMRPMLRRMRRWLNGLMLVSGQTPVDSQGRRILNSSGQQAMNCASLCYPCSNSLLPTARVTFSGITAVTPAPPYCLDTCKRGPFGWTADVTGVIAAANDTFDLSLDPPCSYYLSTGIMVPFYAGSDCTGTLVRTDELGISIVFGTSSLDISFWSETDANLQIFWESVPLTGAYDCQEDRTFTNELPDSCNVLSPFNVIGYGGTAEVTFL